MKPLPLSRSQILGRRLATIQEAADYARCAPRTIRRRIADGTLAGHRLGPRRLLVDLDDLDAALTQIPSAGLGAI